MILFAVVTPTAAIGACGLSLSEGGLSMMVGALTYLVGCVCMGISAVATVWSFLLWRRGRP